MQVLKGAVVTERGGHIQILYYCHKSHTLYVYVWCLEFTRYSHQGQRYSINATLHLCHCGTPLIDVVLLCLLLLLPFIFRRISRNATTRAVKFSMLNCWKNISFWKNGRFLIDGQGRGRGGKSWDTLDVWLLLHQIRWL